MPILEDFGTLKGISHNDFWFPMNHTVTPGANFEKISIAGQSSLRILESRLPYPFYLMIKIETNLTTPYMLWGMRDTQEDYRWGIRFHDDKIIDDQSATEYAIDMTTPRVVVVRVMDHLTGTVYVDGIEAFDFTAESVALTNSAIQYISGASMLGDVTVYQMRMFKNPLELIKYYWFEFLKKWVMDPSDRDAPGNFISYRFPVATFPTEILKPRIDFTITHNMKAKINSRSPHFHTDSVMTIKSYIKNDVAVEGHTNTEALDRIQSQIDAAMLMAYGEIPPLRNYNIQRQAHVYDRRNLAWVGTYVVRAEHFLEGW